MLKSWQTHQLRNIKNYRAEYGKQKWCLVPISLYERTAISKNRKKPEYIQEENFRTISWRTLNTTTRQATQQATRQAIGQATGQATGQANESIIRVVLFLDGEMSRAEIQKILVLKHR
jgi:hypothetical protein